MTDFIAWSHSRRKDWMECPRMFYHKNVAPKGSADRVEFIQTAAMKAGNLIDDALTQRISKGTPLPPQFAPYEKMVASVIAAPGAKYTQLRVTLDQSFKPCGYFDSTAWCRAIYDVAVINGSHAFIGDWKNGSPWLDEDQLKLFAATAFHQFPEIEVVDTAYIWLRFGVTNDKTYTRRELPELWMGLLPEVERLQVAFRNNHWPATPKRGKNSCKRCNVNQQGKCKEAQGPYGS
ncbi:MAG: hypothetical protein NUV51_11670 [Sulfuricaulis sp.]|nr:hypothetical protein [Sulfuricaulis sp.]